MRLYTVGVGERAILVMSVGAEPLMEDRALTDPTFMEAFRQKRVVEKMLADSLATEGVAPAYDLAIQDDMEMQEAVETWLGDDILAGGFWDGDPAAINWRKAESHEALKWHASLAKAVASGEQQPGDENWAVFLVAHSERRRPIRRR